MFISDRRDQFTNPLAKRILYEGDIHPSFIDPMNEQEPNFIEHDNILSAEENEWVDNVFTSIDGLKNSNLAILPTEILFKIFEQLDVKSMVRIRLCKSLEDIFNEIILRRIRKDLFKTVDYGALIMNRFIEKLNFSYLVDENDRVSGLELGPVDYPHFQEIPTAIDLSCLKKMSTLKSLSINKLNMPITNLGLCSTLTSLALDLRRITYWSDIKLLQNIQHLEINITSRNPLPLLDVARNLSKLSSCVFQWGRGDSSYLFLDQTEEGCTLELACINNLNLDDILDVPLFNKVQQLILFEAEDSFNYSDIGIPKLTNLRKVVLKAPCLEFSFTKKIVQLTPVKELVHSIADEEDLDYSADQIEELIALRNADNPLSVTSIPA